MGIVWHSRFMAWHGRDMAWKVYGMVVVYGMVGV